ncbi:hypothetical protein B0O80DRAFT_435620 [Mortierella sp. GBAus27b]|nr:hypothetical protein B0O80DRAFT_435620 [Mortierella sp. GBAus27b]
MASSPVPYKSHIPMHLLRPPKEPVALEEGRSDLTLEPTGPGVRPASEVLMEERDILTGQQAFMASDQPAVQSIQSIDGIPTIEVPSRQTWPGSQPEPVSSLPEPQTISNPDLADQDLPHAPLTIIYTPIPNPESSPQQQDHITDPTEAKNPEGILQDQTFFHGPPTPPPPTGSESESGSSSIGHESESPPTSSSPSSSYTEWYYSLTGLHWMIYIGSQCFLTVLLVMMFLGVLITIEHVLDIEDEDLINLKYHYWARVVGIVSATITSAIHGSILSGYVLLDGHSDWIAKAAVGAICIYWIGITWLMNRVAGPLPY